MIDETIAVYHSKQPSEADGEVRLPRVAAVGEGQSFRVKGDSVDWPSTR
jgi:hypothetical protein